MRPQRFARYIVTRMVLFALVPYTLVLGLVLTFGVASVRKQAIERQSVVAATFAGETALRLEATSASLLVAGAALDSAKLSGGEGVILNALLRARPELSAVWIADAGGIVQFTKPELGRAIGFDLSRSDAVLGGSDGGIAWSRIGLTPFFASASISVSVRAGDHYLIGWLETEALASLSRDRRWGKTGLLFLCDAEGRIVSHPDPLLAQRRESFYDVPAIRSALGGTGASGAYGVPRRFYTAYPVAGAAWAAVAAQDVTEFDSALSGFSWIAFAAFLGASALVALVARRATTRVEQGLTVLVRGSAAVARGDYELDLSHQRIAEFDEMRESFISMRESVKRRELELREVAERLATTAREKTLLVAEVLHRVKNNLAVLDGLLSLETRSANDPHLDEISRRLRSRIQAMSLVHRLLYEGGDIGRIRLDQYLGELAGSIVDAWSPESDGVKLVVTAEPVTLTVAQAVPLGLLVNELATNAFKHAFKGARGGTLGIVAMREAEGSLLVEVLDDGPGLPEGAFNESSGFGLGLARMLAEQLRGELSLGQGPGARIILRFSPAPYDGIAGEFGREGAAEMPVRAAMERE